MLFPGCDLIGRSGPRGMISGGNVQAGHLLLDSSALSPKETEQAAVVIIGGGIAGLSAARELRKKGIADILLLELEAKEGGNAICGRSEVGPYPWAAHYVPIPGDDAVFVRGLFEELGIIERYDAKGLPVYNEYFLCADPQERLFINGLWQEGIIPHFGLPDRDREQIRTFLEAMRRFRAARGSDGRRAFAIPVDHSSQDERYRKYDAISMERYLSLNGWDSAYLRWYVNYCCRDDYGCTMATTSAWAGIHYFASRDAQASNAEPHAVLTWPEGTGWLAERMAKPFAGSIRLNACVLNVANAAGGVVVDYLDTKRGVPVRVKARAAVYAAPRFTALRAVAELRQRRPGYADRFSYAPWMIANVTVRGVPEGKGAELAWDNVSYASRSLGYVMADHQALVRHKPRSVLTYYYPLTEREPVEERKRALNLSFEQWADIIIKDLSGTHPGIEQRIEEVNVWVWGHAMVRPVPGIIWGAARQQALAPVGRIHFAHSDMSGLSLFEEAQYRGIMAARAVAKELTGQE